MLNQTPTKLNNVRLQPINLLLARPTGDRYVGYDYATKKPLEEFLLPPAIDDSLGGLSLALMMQQKQQPQPLLIASSPTNTMTRTPTINNNNQRMLALAAEPKQSLQSQLVSTLPVVGILGRQHHVDAIYHDLNDDVVYVFAGMKFYTHQASDFKVSRESTLGRFKIASCLSILLPRGGIGLLFVLAWQLLF